MKNTDSMVMDFEPFDVITRRETHRRMVVNALYATNGNRTHAAEAMGISIRTLRNWINEFKGKGQQDATMLLTKPHPLDAKITPKPSSVPPVDISKYDSQGRLIRQDG